MTAEPPLPVPAEPPAHDAAGRAVLTGISSRAFEHPADRAALTAMRAIPAFDQLLRLAAGLLRERQYRLAYLASSVRVGPRQFADLHGLFDDVLAVLDAPERPELYVTNDPVPNAMTLGVDRPFIVVTSGLYEIMDDDERRVVLGHELGHAMSGHALYQSMLVHLLNAFSLVSLVPGGGFGLRAVVSALREWSRKAELSGDRAALLATQDLDACVRVHMKLAGGAHLDRIDTEAFLEQAAEYEASGDLRDGVLKLLNTERQTHPFAVVRAAAIRNWAAGAEYGAIIAGDYPRRADDAEAGFAESAREAARAYRDRIDASTDPLVSAVRGFSSTVGEAADGMFDWLSRRARGAAGRSDDAGTTSGTATTGDTGATDDTGTTGGDSSTGHTPGGDGAGREGTDDIGI